MDFRKGFRRERPQDLAAAAGDSPLRLNPSSGRSRYWLCLTDFFMRLADEIIGGGKATEVGDRLNVPCDYVWHVTVLRL